MVQYESLILAVPEITADEQKNLEQNIEKIVKDFKGEFQSFDRWGKYKLAYPVKRNDYGVYYLTRFKAQDENKAELLKELDTFLAVKLVDLIMRHVFSKLKPGQSLEYKHPDSLEDVPAKDVETFLKENKMTGLMPKSDKKDQAEKTMPQEELESIESEESEIQEANESDIQNDEPDLA